MYVNLIIGVFVLGALFYLVSSLMKHLRSPRAILQEEIDERRKRTERVKENIQRIRARAIEKMVPVHKAIAEMNASLMVSQRFVVEGAEETVALRQEGVIISVTYQLASFSVDGSPGEVGAEIAQYGRFLIEVNNTIAGTSTSREAVTHEEAIRLVAREIAVLLQS